jgi:hypothetical protein
MYICRHAIKEKAVSSLELSTYAILNANNFLVREFFEDN